jgi:hypothetical protein
MKLLLALTAVVGALALPVTTGAHNGYHWTDSKAERVLFLNDLRDGGRAVIFVEGVL